MHFAPVGRLGFRAGRFADLLQQARVGLVHLLHSSGSKSLLVLAMLIVVPLTRLLAEASVQVAGWGAAAKHAG